MNQSSRTSACACAVRVSRPRGKEKYAVTLFCRLDLSLSVAFYLKYPWLGIPNFAAEGELQDRLPALPTRTPHPAPQEGVESGKRDLK